MIYSKSLVTLILCMTPSIFLYAQPLPNNIQDIDPIIATPSMPREYKKPHQTTEELLEQDRIIRKISIDRVNKIYKKLKYNDLNSETARVDISLDEHGTVKNISINGQFSEEFSQAIHQAVYRVAPFEMTQDPELNKLLRQIRINFQPE